MTIQLPYGEQASLELDLPAAKLLEYCHGPPGLNQRELGGHVAAALAAPVDFPPFRQAIVPGDRVVLALDPRLPSAAAVVPAVVQTLEQYGVAAEQICVLSAHARQQAEPAVGHWLESCPVEWLGHNPQDRSQLAYLAADAEGRPVYLHRALCDADLVLPLVGFRLNPATGAVTSGGLYPAFSDQATGAGSVAGQSAAARATPTGRSKSAARSKTSAPERSSAAAAQSSTEVEWLLGVQCILGVVPGAAGVPLHVLAGSGESVRRRGAELYRQTWCRTVPARASLVIAGLEGDRTQQTWDQVSRALVSACQVVEPEGAIVLVCELNEPLGPALDCLSQADDMEQALEAIRRRHLPDAAIARRLVQVLEQTRVYLMSGADASQVEALGLAVVESPADVQRLAVRHRSCLLLSSPHYLAPRVAAELALPGDES